MLTRYHRQLTLGVAVILFLLNLYTLWRLMWASAFTDAVVAEWYSRELVSRSTMDAWLQSHGQGPQPSLVRYLGGPYNLIATMICISTVLSALLILIALLNQRRSRTVT